ncbi:MAG: hypothetical protein MPL62_18060, partial [Alphaproteobacteria bacterium]|nr:hypothetical protein [Alphaproteobacteria bacterium]
HEREALPLRGAAAGGVAGETAAGLRYNRRRLHVMDIRFCYTYTTLTGKLYPRTKEANYHR